MGKVQGSGRLAAALAFALGTSACGSTPSSATATAGTAATAAGSSALAAGSGGGSNGGAGGGAASPGGSAGASGASGAAGAEPVTCPEAPPQHQPSGTLLELSFMPTLAGSPLQVGEANQLPDGSLTPSDARFYVSELSLLKEDGSSLPVDLVGADGKEEPYGVHLVSFDEPASATIRTLAPAGNYTGATFTWGVNDGCNASSGLRSPLSFDSQMVWPHVAGFLFLRYEAQWLPSPSAPSASGPPNMIHMGGMIGSISAPTAHISGTFTLPPSGTLMRSVEMSFDQIFMAASSTVDVSDAGILFSSPEVMAGERLRRAVPTLSVFKLVP